MRTNRGTETINDYFKGVPNTDEGFRQWVIDKINNIETIDELRDNVFGATMGHQFPLNPPSPIRETYQKKVEELRSQATAEEDHDFLHWISDMVKGDWKPIDIPDGAMY